MREYTHIINDEQGIHARPAGLFVKAAVGFKSKITISKDGREVDAKRIFGVMSLAAKKDQTIVIRADGEDEVEAIQILGEFAQANM